MIGKTIGNYRIVEKLGRGATGTVFKALDETLGREVAIKMLHPALAETEVMKRFQTEVKALANLNHPEIATIHDVQMTADGVLLVTELVRGESLDALLKRVGPLAPERAALLAAQILSAIGHAHDVQVVHRDLRPSNVMVTESGGVKLLDFAMAPVEGASQMTAAAFAIGTPAYMAPERILGNDVDPRADIYSVGVIFYRLLTDKVPFEAPTPTEMVQRQLNEPPTPLRIYRPDVPPWCEEIVARALAKTPGDRYRTAAEFRAALLQAIAASSSETTGFHHAVSSARPAGDGATIASAAPLSPVAAGGDQAASVAQLASVIDPNAATFMAAVPAEAVAGIAAEEPTAPVVAPPPDPDATFVAPTPEIAADIAPVVTPAARAATAPVVVPLAAVPQADYWGQDPTIVGARLADFADGAEPTLALPRATTPPSAKGREPTMLVPAATAPTVAAPMEALAPTVMAPVAPAPTGTLVMPRKQFAAAGVVLGLLALVAVILAVIVVRRSATVVEPPTATVAPAASVTPPTAPITSGAPATPESVVAVAVPPIAASTAPPPPLEIAEPAILTAPADAPGSGGGRGGARSARGATATTPVVAPPANPNLAKITSSTPFKFEAKAVVVDGDKRRERDAHILVADGSVTVSQNDDKVIYALPISALTSLTYSSSKQPLWNSPNGPAEAMRVDSGAFGFLKGGRNWLGFQTPDALMILRVDDQIVGRVIAGLQERTGLPVARLIEPKE